MKYSAKIREEAMKLNPIDDVFFVKMAEDLGFCEELLQTILEDKNVEVLDNNYQYMIKNLQRKSCVLDLLCKLGNGRYAHVEVQKADDDNHQKRVRYNESVLTANIVAPGEKYEFVPDVISVFISKFDVFGEGLASYHVDRIIRETSKIVNNGIKEIYINSKNDDSSDIAELMKIFTNDLAYNDEKFPKTSRRKRLFKTTDKGVNIMCDIIKNIVGDIIEENKREVTKNMVINMLKVELSYEEIARIAEISVKEVQEIEKQTST